MDINIYLIGGFVYDEKDKTTRQSTGSQKFRLSYFYAEKKYKRDDNSKFKGFQERAAYLPVRVADEIPNEWYGTSVVAHISTEPDERDPLKEKKVLKSISKDDTIVNLC